jgi:hypothetical protein
MLMSNKTRRACHFVKSSFRDFSSQLGSDQKKNAARVSAASAGKAQISLTAETVPHLLTTSCLEFSSFVVHEHNKIKNQLVIS